MEERELGWEDVYDRAYAVVDELVVALVFFLSFVYRVIVPLPA